jgi:hypothetical protein
LSDFGNLSRVAVSIQLPAKVFQFNRLADCLYINGSVSENISVHPAAGPCKILKTVFL